MNTATVYSAEDFSLKFRSYQKLADISYVEGTALDFNSGYGTASLPKSVKVSNPKDPKNGAAVTVSRCYIGLPTESLEVEGSLYIQKWHSANLPQVTKARKLTLEKCQGLRTLPKTLEVQSLMIDNCDQIKLPTSMACDLTLKKYKHALPDGFTITGDLSLVKCKRLTALPEGITINGNLWITDCENLETLPKKLKVTGRIVVIGSQKIADQFELRALNDILLQFRRATELN